MTLLSPNHNHAADECMAKIPQHHIPTTEEKVRASQSFDKSVLVAAHMAALHDAYILEMVTHPVQEVTIKPSSPTSSIGGLKRSTLKQLKVGKVHRRRVINGTLCVETLCTKSHNGLMVVNVFEDEEGSATPIYLSDAMEGNGGSAQAQQLYPQGSKVAVKEPYLTRLPDGEIVLLVEKTTDLVFLWVPDHVEEKRVENGGSKGSGLHEDDRDVDMAEKEKDDSCDGTKKKKKSDGDLVEEGVECVKASLDPKFDDAICAEEEKRKDEGAAIGRESSGKSQEAAMAEESTEVIPSGEEEGKEGEVGAVATAASNVGSRELSLDDLLAMRKGEGGHGDSEEAEGETEGNASENASMVQEAEIREIEKEEVKEELSNDGGPEESELIQGGVKSSPGNAINVGIEAINVGIEAENASEVRTREIKEEEVKEAASNEGGRETAAMLRVKGNALFARGDFNNAVSVYLRGADVARADGSKMEEVLCLSNRAEVLLRLCRNQAALDDAEAALKLLRASDGFDAGDLALAKALFRKGRALMGLHKYEDGMRVLQEVLAKAPADRMLREAALKCRRHLEHVLKPGKRQRAAANRKKSSAPSKQ